jgi:hypothetical protein
MYAITTHNERELRRVQRLKDAQKKLQERYDNSEYGPNRGGELPLEVMIRLGKTNKDLDAKIRESLNMSKETIIKRKGGGQVIKIEGQPQPVIDLNQSPRKESENKEGNEAANATADERLNSLENLKLRGLIKANYLFNTVSRDKL